MKLIKLFIIASLFFFASILPALTETKTFVREYTYQASEFDSKASCRTLALEQAKRLLLEEIGTYLESLTEVNNFQLTKDQIIILTAGIVRVQVVDEKWDGKAYYLLAKITANPDDVAKAIDNLRKDRQKIKELEQAKKKSDELFKEVENLREELRTSKNKKTKAFRQKQKEYEKMVISMSAIEWYNLGKLSGDLFKGVSPTLFEQWSVNRKASYERQIFAFSKAISLNPNYTEAYIERGHAYHYIGLYQKAIYDFNQAIKLNPELAKAYQRRADTYAELGNYDQMMKDYDRAMAITPDDCNLYRDRAWIFQFTKDFGMAGLDQAVKDRTKVIELEPTVYSYWQRGSLYEKKGDYELAIRDYDKVIELDPEWSHYRDRGKLFAELKKYQQALDDYTMAINSYNKKGDVYSGSGSKPKLYLARMEIYENIGDKEHAEQDLIEAIKLDPDSAPVSRAERLFKHGRYGDAIQAINEDFALAMRIMPQNSDRLLLEGYVVRCICYYQMKNYNRALIECTDGTKIDSGDVRLRSALYVIRSIIYRSMGNYRNSLSDLNQAIEINPQESDIYILRGIYLSKKR